MIVSLHKRLIPFDRSVREGRWRNVAARLAWTRNETRCIRIHRLSIVFAQFRLHCMIGNNSLALPNCPKLQYQTRKLTRHVHRHDP